MIEAAQREDWETALSCYDEAVELDQTRMPDGGTYTGIEGVRQFYSGWIQSWDEFRMTLQQLVDVGERVVAISDIRGTGRGSGLAVNMRSADVFTLREGRIVGHVGYPEASEALEAVGLGE